MNDSTCGTSRTAPRRLSARDTAVVIVIIVTAALLAYTGWQIVSVVVLTAEVATLGVRFLRRLRGGGGRPALGLTEV
ncbi:hypothetical protein AQF52_1175 [Streptomyces venezuelae]|uniref:hypothetical protein n=1 Tax=Streptomyces gardneri TaxID=66892 RepID=UPI0006BD049D|nr:hypothetical protein [Streptomyces gardneri]ALO06771.1 hypothetical protein AQF52_1175 [Streptomyces venezuelae]QPK44166.1 hypothetical protein H4W23_05775 [Streptomyces gardneri]WRK35444.1 hypothetical protein U0M97_05810 [Streptomyces venezuelae]CUM42937.1 hypothetical protein BN2537_14839 [Streptomyces venezuelae]